MEGHGYLYDLLRKLHWSEFAARTGEFILVRPLKIVLLILMGVVVARIGARAARRFVNTLHVRSPVRSLSPRAGQRVETVGNVLAGMVRVAVAIVVALLVLGEVGVDLAPFIAGAGIAGVAIGFGAQSLVKDFLSGLFILMEDQYGVGDVIDVGEVTGTVEDLSLRVTRLRATDGTVWFVPNSEIKRVGNTSMEWSRALIDVLVPYGNDLAAVTRSLTAVAGELAGEEAWKDSLIEPPQVWGVQTMTVEGVTIRMVAKTSPSQQYAVARELRGRITETLRREGIHGLAKTAAPIVTPTGTDPRSSVEEIGPAPPDIGPAAPPDQPLSRG